MTLVFLIPFIVILVLLVTVAICNAVRRSESEVGDDVSYRFTYSPVYDPKVPFREIDAANSVNNVEVLNPPGPRYL